MEEEKPRTNTDAPAPLVVHFGPYELNLRSAELRKSDNTRRITRTARRGGAARGNPQEALA